MVDNFENRTVNEYLLGIAHNQSFAKYLAPGGLTRKVFELRGAEGVNSSDLMDNSEISPRNFLWSAL